MKKKQALCCVLKKVKLQTKIFLYIKIKIKVLFLQLQKKCFYEYTEEIQKHGSDAVHAVYSVQYQ